MAATQPAATRRPVSLVWIDAREARIVRDSEGGRVVERIESEVPRRIRSTGQVRHRPGVHGGAGSGEASAEQHRREHLARFLEQVAGALGPDDDLVIEGPGEVHELLARAVRDADHGRPHPRAVASEAAPKRTDRQLVERARLLAGDEPPRREVGV